MPADRATVAAFDVDGTVTVRDCVVPFLRRAGGTVGVAARLAGHPLGLAGALARRDRDDLKARAVAAALAGRPFDEVTRLGEAFAAEVVDGWLRPDVVGRLRWHRDEGHVVVLVSASLAPYLEPVGRHLGVDAVLCTQVEVGPDGRCTGRLVGANCRGLEKAHRLRAWLGDRDLEGAELWSYGDSAGDHELLAMADRAVMVRGVTVEPVPASTPA